MKYEACDDFELVRLTLAGTSEAYDVLTRRYCKRIYALALRIVGNREDAEDAVQSAFLQAYKHLANFRQTSQFYTWLFRIGHNAAVALLRKRRPSTSIDELSETAGDVFRSNGDSPDADATRADNSSLLDEALAMLPEEYRTPLLLCEMDGLKYEDIAAVLSVPVGTVRSRLHRARAAMRENLTRLGYTPE